MRILVLENDREAAYVMLEILRADGNEVDLAQCGPSAIQLSTEFCPDLILSDWDLGEPMNGIEACRIIRANFPSMKIILVSGSPIEEFTEAAEGLNPVAFFAKPVSFEKLAKTLEWVRNDTAQL